MSWSLGWWQCAPSKFLQTKRFPKNFVNQLLRMNGRGSICLASLSSARIIAWVMFRGKVLTRWLFLLLLQDSVSLCFLWRPGKHLFDCSTPLMFETFVWKTRLWCLWPHLFGRYLGIWPFGEGIPPSKQIPLDVCITPDSLAVHSTAQFYLKMTLKPRRISSKMFFPSKMYFLFTLFGNEAGADWGDTPSISLWALEGHNHHHHHHHHHNSSLWAKELKVEFELL